LQSKNYAAVDIGTNSFHLIIVKAKEDGSLEIIDREKEVIRLGSQKGSDLNFISNDEFEKAVKILSHFKKLADFYKADIHAVATSAVREAENRDMFINKILVQTGIKIEIIDGHKEAEYIYKGVRKALPYNLRLLCVDIGGGSTEFILGHNENIVFGESIKIGAVRLSKKFFPGFILDENAVNDCRLYIEEQIRTNPNVNFSEKFDIAVGSSGTILAAAGMLNYKRNGKKVKSLNEFTFDASELKILTEEILNRKTPEQRINLPGMEYKRADIIPAGLLILDKVFEMLNLKQMVVSEFALREGVVLSMIEKEKINDGTIKF
jgi:exopolyphosphatase / guanosine-5'-triphosphate,3'-diphosphate pyrophosphatase